MVASTATDTYRKAQTLRHGVQSHPTRQASALSDQTQSYTLKQAKWMTDEVKTQRETRKSNIIKWSLVARKHTRPLTKEKHWVQDSINLQCAGRVEPHVFDKSSSRAGWGNDEVISVLWTGSNSLGRAHFKWLQANQHTHAFPYICTQ